MANLFVQQFRRRPKDVHRLQLRPARDQDLHVPAGVAVQVAEGRRARGGLRPLFPAHPSDQLVCENEEEGSVSE
jgi:hypothetical protein